MFATIMLLLIAGHETTVSGILALLRYPDQWQKLKADPSLVTNAIEEMIRFGAPIQFTARTATVELEFQGGLSSRGRTSSPYWERRTATHASLHTRSASTSRAETPRAILVSAMGFITVLGHR
jgi:cytochrome P450